MTNECSFEKYAISRGLYAEALEVHGVKGHYVNQGEKMAAIACSIIWSAALMTSHLYLKSPTPHCYCTGCYCIMIVKEGGVSMSEKNHNRQLPFLILRYLTEEASSENPVTQTKIAEDISKEWGVPLNRKTVNRYFKMFIEDLGYKIGSSSRGYWLINEFSDYEVRLLSDAVMSSKYISSEESKEIIHKLANLASKEYRNKYDNIVVMSDDEKCISSSLFTKLEIINTAIINLTNISFEYTSWYRNEDKRKERSGHQNKTPVCIIYMDQRYYMVTGYNDEEFQIHTEYFALDKMSSVKKENPDNRIRTLELTDDNRHKIKEISSLKEPSDINKKHIRVLATEIVMHTLESHFGKRIIKREYDESAENGFKYDVYLESEETVFMQFLKENMNELKIVSPPALVNEFKKNLQVALDMYN